MATEVSLDISQNSARIFAGHLKLGGRNQQGRSIEFTNYYMLQNGKPCIPVMGEFHFSRYQHAFWEEELLKMKAGGIDIIATYVFWIHIEEDEGVFDWSGNKNLRQFIALCGKHQLDALVRIGPFAHGECRNGGLPDWLYGRPFEVRSNDERYLAYARRFYEAIAQQLAGLLFKDGGPVIGIQLDNEYMHCGAPWEVTFNSGTEWVPSGSEGAAHIARLKEIALAAGLDVPIYACTGWLNSPILEDEILPMQGGYAFTPWSPDPNYRQPPTREYLFRNRQQNPVLNGKPTYDAERYPYACCEIGGGIQITYHHRPIVPPESVEALALMNLAGGANLLGYYMYHGGSNPVGKHSYLNEFTVPRISYDFQAPLREFGQTNHSYRGLRLLHLFLRDFGEVLAPMSVILPPDASAITPENTTDLRWSVRAKDGAGFVFLNNYQDHVDMQDIADIRLRLSDTLTIPHSGTFTLQKNVCAILPFGLSLHGVRLNYATTQLLTKIEQQNSVTYVFFAPHGMMSEYAFDRTTYDTLTVNNGEVTEADGCAIVRVNPGRDCVITLTNAEKTMHIVTLTRKQAENCTKQYLWQQERLIITDATCVTTDADCWLYSIGENTLDVWLYPAVEGTLKTDFGAFTASKDGFFTKYSTAIPQKEISLNIETIDSRKALVRFPPQTLDNVHNVFLRVDYVGDMGSAFIDGKLVADNFYNDTLWEIGLKQVTPDLQDLLLLITPVMQNTGGARYIPTGMAFRVDSNDERLGVIRAVTAVPEYKIAVRWV
jgi:hypothetical protein